MARRTSPTSTRAATAWARNASKATETRQAMAESRREDVEILWRRGLTVAEIAARVGVSPRTVYLDLAELEGRITRRWKNTTGPERQRRTLQARRSRATEDPS